VCRQRSSCARISCSTTKHCSGVLQQNSIVKCSLWVSTLRRFQSAWDKVVVTSFVIIRLSDICRKTLSLTHELSFYLSFLSIHGFLSNRAEDSRQMYSGGSVVGWFRDRPPLPEFSQGSKSAKFGIFLTSFKFELPTIENAARYLNSETNLLSSDDCPMSSPRLVKLGPCTPENRPEKVSHPEKLHSKNVLNRR